MYRICIWDCKKAIPYICNVFQKLRNYNYNFIVYFHIILTTSGFSLIQSKLQVNISLTKQVHKLKQQSFPILTDRLITALRM